MLLCLGEINKRGKNHEQNHTKTIPKKWIELQGDAKLPTTELH